jgi:hypothetical protein
MMNATENMRDIQKVTSSELITKQAIREKKYWYIQKNVYVLKLLLNVVITGIEALVISRNTILYASVKEVCCL